MNYNKESKYETKYVIEVYAGYVFKRNLDEHKDYILTPVYSRTGYIMGYRWSLVE